MSRLTLFASRTSPYVRKVVISALETEQFNDIDFIETDVWDPDPEILDINPLGKVPALVVPGEGVIYDSLVICEYLDNRHNGRRLIPQQGPARWSVLTRHALADGVMSALLARRWELRFRPKEQQSDFWMKRQSAKIGRGLDALEEEASAFSDSFSLDAITVVSTLAYMDMRMDLVAMNTDWRVGRPKLSAWYEKVRERASVVRTAA